MSEKHRLAAFKAMLESQQSNAYPLAEADGSLRFWRDLSADARLEKIARSAVLFDVPFEQMAQAVRESIDNPAVEESALRLAMRSVGELHAIEKLLPNDERTLPPPLVERVGELLRAQPDEYEDESALDPKEQAALFKELRDDYAAAKRENAHWYGSEAYQRILDAKAKAPAVEKGNDRQMER
jgi:hypothetical protein